ncbi:signal peptidase I [Pradoshia eiseniae]|uniref:Signal peptidase I n=1 Tax=Pradoshia eiseniae TaxID=2064768 RepID=A0A2S7N0F8_9BACI|nr:signal peptidase I [Pradoshia eiseniae]PQD95487.1 signal peptidase I [Pradoshia eiseniae]
MSRRTKDLFYWSLGFVCGIALLVQVQNHLYSNYRVDGKSMDPTLQEGNRLIVTKAGFDERDIEHFDIIVFHKTKQEDYVKRVIGLPGDEITYRNGSLYINQQYIEESYISETAHLRTGLGQANSFTLKTLMGVEKVPKGMLFVLGDNRNMSYDSRHFGFVPIDSVVGKVNMRYWPLTEWQADF